MPNDNPIYIGSVPSSTDNPQYLGSFSGAGSGGGSLAIGSPVTSGTVNDILFVGAGGLLAEDPKLTWTGITFKIGTVLTDGILTFNTPAPSGPAEYFPMRLRRDSADGFTQLVVENTIAGGFCGFAAVDDDTGNDQLGEGFIAVLYFGALGGSIDDSNFITLSDQGHIRTGLNAVHGMSIGTEVGPVSFFTGGIDFVDERMRIDAVGNVIVSFAALPTNSTDGFLYIPTSAGAPVGTPTSYSGRAPIEYDTVNNDFYVYYSGAWHKVHLTAVGVVGGEYFADRYFTPRYWTHNYFN